MKNISMSELVPGDIFTEELKLNGREAFKVIKVTDKKVLCQSRKDFIIKDGLMIFKEVSKLLKGQVILPRHESI